MNEKPVKCCGQQQQWESVPPYQTPGESSNNDFSGPPSLLWSPWLELGTTKSQIPVFKLSITPELNSKLS